MLQQYHRACKCGGVSSSYSIWRNDLDRLHLEDCEVQSKATAKANKCRRVLRKVR